MSAVPSSWRNEPREDQPSMLAAALGYARQGWRVFPLHGIRPDGQCDCGHSDCRDPGKHPYTLNGLYNATTSETLIQTWWKRWPQANIGGRTGSRVVAVDPDSEEGLAELLKYGMDPDSVHTTSRPGHRHQLYKPPAGLVLQNQAKKQGHWPFQYCDGRGEGGYIVLPPSRHASGTRYTASGPIDLETLPEIPPDLLEAWKTPPSDPRSAVVVWDESDGAWVEEVDAVDYDSGEGYYTAGYFLRRYTQEALQGADRNPTGFLLALQLRDVPLTWDAAMPLMRKYQVAVEDIKPGEKPYEWKEADASLKQAYTREKRERVHKRTNATEEDRPRLCLLTDVEAENLPRQHGFLGDILFADSIAFLYGPSGIWKTFVALDWGLTSAAGGYWFDHEISQGSAVFITGEGAANVGTRITAWKRYHNVKESIPLYLVPQAIQFLQDGQITELIQLLEEQLGETPPQLVVVDTLALAIAGGDENGSQDAMKLLAAGHRIRAAFGCCVLFIHHTGYDQSHMRGSTALFANADIVIKVEGGTAGQRVQPGTPVRLVSEKSRDHGPFQPIHYTTEVASWTGPDGEPVDSLVVVPCNKPARPVKPEATKPPKSSFSDAAIKAWSVLVKLTATLHKGATNAEWETACCKTGVIGRSTYYTSRSQLLSSGWVIVYDSRYIATTPGASDPIIGRNALKLPGEEEEKNDAQ